MHSISFLPQRRKRLCRASWPVRLLQAALLACLHTAGVHTVHCAPPSGAKFIMSHFKSDNGGGDERLYISVSTDALHWTTLNGGAAVWQPEGWAPFANVVRDPSIIYDNGFYWVAYTSGNYGRHASFGLVKSADLLNWTPVGEISTAVPGATDPLTWNPCFFRDGDGSVHLFVSVSPINGSVYNPVPAMRTYELHPLSSDWTAWSAPQAVALPSGNTNEFWAWKEGDTYHAIYVDFAANGVQVHATSQSLLSGWGNTRVFGFASQEGGMAIRKPGGGYRIFLERGNIGDPSATYRWCDADDSFTTFSAQQAVQSDVGMRNGKMTAAPDTLHYADWQVDRLGGKRPEDQAPQADPDRDGLPNLLEYALALDPTAPDVSEGPRLAAAHGAVPPGASITLRRSPQAADLALSFEASSDLSVWTPAGTDIVVQSRTLLSDGSEEIVASATPTSAHPARFLRVRATLLQSP